MCSGQEFGSKGNVIHKGANLVFRIYSMYDMLFFTDFESPCWLICLTNFSAKDGRVLVATGLSWRQWSGTRRAEGMESAVLGQSVALMRPGYMEVRWPSSCE